MKARLNNRHRNLLLALIERRLVELNFSARQVELIPAALAVIDDEIRLLHEIQRALTEPSQESS